jgi:sugar lactone lactonase YvrE
VLAIEEGFAVLDSFAGEPRLVAAIDHGPGPATRMNDGKCDSQGRFWAGSMAYDCAPGHGALYRLDPDLRVSKVLGGITISNGLDWSDNGRTLFYIDTLAGASFWDVINGTVRPGIDAFDIDPVSASLSRRHRLFDIPAEQGVPTGMALADGMTIDAEGSLWVAVHGTGQVRRYSLGGDLEAVVELPVACPTSVAFGGEDLGDLYITSMTPRGAPGPDPRTPVLMWDPRPLEGALFRCRPGVPGRSPHVFRG